MSKDNILRWMRLSGYWSGILIFLKSSCCHLDHAILQSMLLCSSHCIEEVFHVPSETFKVISYKCFLNFLTCSYLRQKKKWKGILNGLHNSTQCHPCIDFRSKQSKIGFAAVIHPIKFAQLCICNPILNDLWKVIVLL